MTVFKHWIRAAVVVSACWLATAVTSRAADVYVAPGGAGTGTSAAPFGTIQDAVNAAQPGDVIHVAAGAYAESLRTVRAGTSTTRITLRARGSRGSVLVNGNGRVLTVGHAYFTIEGLVLDGAYGTDDIVRVTAAATGFTLRNSEVRRGSRDGVDIGATSDVLIEDTLIHHTLNPTDGRTDAHGVVAAAAHHLTIRNTEIHTFSGDAFQIDPSRAAPGWDDVVIDGCKLWLGPLATATNGFAAGTIPGENAVDTKSDSRLPRAHITIRNTEAWGFKGGLISNMAAFNIKENIDATFDGVTVHDSEIAFRLRGPSSTRPAGAWVRVQNAVVYNGATAFRYEDNIENLRIWNATVGNGMTRAFQAANAAAAGIDVRNFLLLGPTLPPFAHASSSLAVSAAAFVDAGRNNYQLSAGSRAIDAGVRLPQVRCDRQNTARPQGAAYDIGAYERAGDARHGPDPCSAPGIRREGRPGGAHVFCLPGEGAGAGDRRPLAAVSSRGAQSPAPARRPAPGVRVPGWPLDRKANR